MPSLSEYPYLALSSVNNSPLPRASLSLKPNWAILPLYGGSGALQGNRSTGEADDETAEKRGKGSLCVGFSRSKAGSKACGPTFAKADGNNAKGGEGKKRRSLVRVLSQDVQRHICFTSFHTWPKEEERLALFGLFLYLSEVEGAMTPPGSPGRT